MRSLSVACLVIVVVTGCADEGPQPRTPYPLTDPQPQAHAQSAADGRVIERIVAATCDREQSCGTIGPGAYFGTRDECTRVVRDKTRTSLNASQCPGGIDLRALESCLSSLEATECAQPGDVITRAARCPTADLCMK